MQLSSKIAKCKNANMDEFCAECTISLLLITPSSVFISKLFEHTYHKISNRDIFDTGSIIGILERIFSDYICLLSKFCRNRYNNNSKNMGKNKRFIGKLYGQWLCEGAVFVYDFKPFDVSDIFSLFAEYNITTFCAPPTMYRIMKATTAGEVLNSEVFKQIEKMTGFRVKTSIVLTKGTVGTDKLKKEIQNYVKEKTAPYKYPRIVEFKTELPKTISGKIQRNKL